MTTSSDYLVTHPNELRMLSVLPFRGVRARGTIRLGGALAERPERTAWEHRLNASYYACGCDTGAKGLLLAFIAGGAIAALQFRRGALTTGSAIGWAFGIALVGAVLGKLVGLVAAELRLRATIREITMVAPPTLATDPVPSSCG